MSGQPTEETNAGPGCLAPIREICAELLALSRERNELASIALRLQRAVHVAATQLEADVAAQEEMMMEHTASLQACHWSIVDAASHGQGTAGSDATDAMRKAELAEAALASMLQLAKRDGSQIGNVLSTLFDSADMEGAQAI